MTWNTRGYTGPTKNDQLRAVLDLDPDIVALQEVVRGSLAFWRDSLEDKGCCVVHSEVELLGERGPILPHTARRFGKRRNLNLIASKAQLQSTDGLPISDPAKGFPEKYLVAQTEIDGRTIEIHNAHTPPGSTVKMLKVEFWEAMLERLAQPTDAARILCGDFNSPWSESDEKFVVGGGRADSAEEARWAKAELGFLRHRELRDPYRFHHRPGKRFAVSHWRGSGRNRTGCRYDHIYAAERDFDLAASRCVYREELLERGLSDHAPALATLKLRSGGSPSPS